MPLDPSLQALMQLDPALALSCAGTLMDSDSPLIQAQAVELGSGLIQSFIQADKFRTKPVLDFCIKMLSAPSSAVAVSFASGIQELLKTNASSILPSIPLNNLIALEAALPGFVTHARAETLLHCPEAIGHFYQSGCLPLKQLIAAGKCLTTVHSNWRNYQKPRAIQDDLEQFSAGLLRTYPTIGQHLWDLFWATPMGTETQRDNAEHILHLCVLNLKTPAPFKNAPPLTAAAAPSAQAKIRLLFGAAQWMDHPILHLFGAWVAQQDSQQVLNCAAPSFQGGEGIDLFTLNLCQNLSALNASAIPVQLFPLKHSEAHKQALAFFEGLLSNGAPPPQCRIEPTSLRGFHSSPLPQILDESLIVLRYAELPCAGRFFELFASWASNETGWKQAATISTRLYKMLQESKLPKFIPGGPYSAAVTSLFESAQLQQLTLKVKTKKKTTRKPNL